MRDGDDAQDERIADILGDAVESELDEAVAVYYDYLKAHLTQPCVVTGIEDFRWEEYYVMGPGSETHYARLKKNNPSYTDLYELLEIVPEADPEWSMFYESDLGARVRRKSDGKAFLLGLAELKALDRKSKNYQLLDDYSVWLVNSR